MCKEASDGGLAPRVDPDDPISTARGLARQVRDASVSELRHGCILAGLSQLGDARVTPPILEAWPTLDVTTKETFTLTDSEFTTVARVDLLVSLLEIKREDSVVGSLAGALGRLRGISQLRTVSDIEREMPVTTGQPIRKLGEYTFAEYGKLIRPRLEALSRLESKPKVIPQVIEVWT